MRKIVIILTIFISIHFAVGQEQTNWLQIKSNLLGTNDNLGFFTQLDLSGDISLMPFLKQKKMELGSNNFLIRWNELKGRLNAAYFYEKKEQIHDADLTTGLRVKALKNWPLIFDFDLGWVHYNYVDSISNFNNLTVVNNLIVLPHIWYVLSNSATTNSEVWNRLIVDANLDLRTI